MKTTKAFKGLMVAAKRAAPTVASDDLATILAAALRQMMADDARWSDCIRVDYLGIKSED